MLCSRVFFRVSGINGRLTNDSNCGATFQRLPFYDLVQDKAIQIPKQGERRERELQELVKRPNGSEAAI